MLGGGREDLGSMKSAKSSSRNGKVVKSCGLETAASEEGVVKWPSTE